MSPSGRRIERLLALFGELKRRRVFRVAGVYLVAAWGTVEVTTTVLPLMGAPEWAARVVFAIVAAGFPVALVLAWVFDITPAGLRIDAADAGVPARHVRMSQAVLLTAAAVVGLAVPLFLLVQMRSQTSPGDPGTAEIAIADNRVMVFPFRTSSALEPLLGEDISTLIAHALDGAGDLRSFDGWSVMTPEERTDIRLLTDARVRELARSRGCRYALTGQIVVLSGEVEVVVQLEDVMARSIFPSRASRGNEAEVWQLGLNAATQVLPEILPAGSTHLGTGWDRRPPAAVASFLRGEQHFRRARFEDALRSYDQAIAADSTFALAALRAAQGAAWTVDPERASHYARLTLRQPMPPRFAELVRGFVAYHVGQAAVALQHFERVIADDPAMPIAWMQIGEVYRHLLPRARRPDSVAVAAFREAARLAPGGFESYFHLLEAALHAGDLAAAEPLLARFRADDIDEPLRRRVELMHDCVRDGPDPVRWNTEARADASQVFLAAKTLAAAAMNLGCAEVGYRTLYDGTPDDVSNRWSAVKGLHATLLARGRTTDATAFLDDVIRTDTDLAWAARRFHIIGALVSDVPAAVAEDAARVYRDEVAAGTPNANNLWTLAMWEARNGRVDAVRLLAEAVQRMIASATLERDALAARGEDVEGAGQTLRRLRLIDASVRGHLALARGDSTAALEILEGLVPDAPAELLSWHFFEPLGLDQLTLATLLLRQGRYEDALTVADVFDSPAPMAYLWYLPASLRLRLEAAEALGLEALARDYRMRIDNLPGP